MVGCGIEPESGVEPPQSEKGVCFFGCSAFSGEGLFGEWWVAG